VSSGSSTGDPGSPAGSRCGRERPDPIRWSGARLRRGPWSWTRIALLGAAIAAAPGSWAEVRQAPLSPAVARNADPASALPTKQVLRLALRADSSQQYLLYVPGSGGRGAPLFIDVHGFSRNVEEHAALLAPYAEKYGVVLVSPFFDREGHDDYQRLGRLGHGRRADLALDAILQEVLSLTGASTGKFYLFGFSGGAQFAHRYALAHPERLAGAAVAAPGWYTFPDRETPYPYGLGPCAELPDVRFDPDAFLRVPITVFVGEADTGSENLRRNLQVDRQQGTTRRERAERWTAAMRRAAEARGYRPLVSCVRVAGIGHSFRQFMEAGELGSRVFESMFGPVSMTTAPSGSGP